jgi:hypothetical protein
LLPFTDADSVDRRLLRFPPALAVAAVAAVAAGISGRHTFELVDVCDETGPTRADRCLIFRHPGFILRLYRHVRHERKAIT